MMKIKNLRSIIFVLISTLFVSVAQMFWKFASQQFSFTFQGIFLNLHLYLGFFIYGFALVLLLIALKEGDLSVVYPILGTSYMWVLFIARFFFKEYVSLTNLIGVFIIILGVIFITQGNHESVKVKKRSHRISKGGRA